MFDIGFAELLICGVLVLVVLGPERLPRVARTLGRFAGQARAYLRNLNAEIDRELRMQEMRQQLEQTRRAMDAGLDEVRGALDAGMADTRQRMREAADEASGRTSVPRDRPSDG